MRSAINKEIFFNQDQYKEQLEYWLNIISGGLISTDLTIGINKGNNAKKKICILRSELSRNLSMKILKFVSNNDITLYIFLLTVFKVLLYKYTWDKEILISSPLLIIDNQVEKINKHNKRIILRDFVKTDLTFKELLIETKDKTLEAYRNQDYPLDLAFRKASLNIDNIPFLDRIIFLSRNIHNEGEIIDLKYDLMFSFSREDENIFGDIKYDNRIFARAAIEEFTKKYVSLMEICVDDVNIKIKDLNILSEEEVESITSCFINNTKQERQEGKTIQSIFEGQVRKTPDNVAVTHGMKQLTYRELNDKSNQLARLLRNKGVNVDSIIGVMMDNSPDMIISILSILKSGSSYLPISPDSPQERIMSMLNDCNILFLLTKSRVIKRFGFIPLRNFERGNVKKYITSQRPQVIELDELQIPDRSLVNYEKYHPFIGQSMVKNSITIQFSRGCVYKCLYCFKIWTDRYTTRSGENLFNEIQFYYKMGIRRFGFVDDLPNFDKKEIEKFYRLIIKNGLKVHLHFPNGVRGDILSKEHVDLMVEAGAVTIDFGLETASPRLQKLIRKNVNIDKLCENVHYIIDNYPHVILGIQLIHGFPTETEEEAKASLDFIKSFRWLSFGYLHILKIYPDTEMARLAVDHGVSKAAILNSVNLSYHNLPETLPFSKKFSKRYQAEYLSEFFLLKERLLKVLPGQMSMLTEDELVQKYNSYLPVEIRTFPELLNYAGIRKDELAGEFLPDDYGKVDNFNEKLRKHFPIHKTSGKSLRLLLLDLSQHFTTESDNMYCVVDPPLGLMYLLTELNRKFGDKIWGKIAKSKMDFDSYDELESLIKDFKPDVIGVRTLAFYKDFFHKTVSIIRQWENDIPIIAGGPYATSSYQTMLEDTNIDLAVLGEGEKTLSEIVAKIIQNNGKLPGDNILKHIPGIAFVEKKNKPILKKYNREILLLDKIQGILSQESGKNLPAVNSPNNLVYIIYTSGSTGNPKGVMIDHISLVNQIAGLKKEFNLDSSLNYILLAPFTFDVSIMHVFLSLTTGAKINLISEELKKDPLQLWQYISIKDINVLNIVPGFLKVLLENRGEEKLYLKYLFIGGDVFTKNLYCKLKEIRIADEIINIYGTTETTINALLYKCRDDEIYDTIRIGKPLMNYRTYIFDRDFNFRPIGVKGELCISGSGVARGYLNSPELTEDKFIKHQLLKGEGFYRTGDLVRWLPDGNMEFIGRNDHQVKLRGFRIEPGEIENQLLKHEKIKEALVLSREEKTGDKCLCAYIVAAGTNDKIPESAELREYLSGTLPGYMIPSYFVPVDRIHLTSSGKLDRKNLPQPVLKRESGYMASGNEVENKLVEIWSEVLGIEKEKLSVDKDFFNLGGHSLKAVILVSSIHKELEVKVPLSLIFNLSTIRELSQHIKKAKKEKYVALKIAEKKEYYILSPAQKRLFILQQMKKDNISYNISKVMMLKGEPYREKLHDTFVTLIKRHESLRTSFKTLTGEPVQRIHQEVDFEMEYHRSIKENLGEEGQGTGMKVEEILLDFIRPFDLLHAPLFRVGLRKVTAGDYLLMVDMHHIISDGVSHDILEKEFKTLYQGGDELSPLRVQYKDYTVWVEGKSKSDEIKRQEKYWIDLFPGELPVLKLPTDFPRPKVQSFAGAFVNFMLNKEKTRDLNALGNENEATLYMVILALFNILLAKLSGQEDIIVGTPIAARRHVDLDNIIGMFVNTLTMRNFPVKDKTFKEFLREVKERALAAYENQEYQFESLVGHISAGRDISRNPVFDVIFNLNNESEYAGNRPPTDDDEIYEYGIGTAKVDLSLIAFESVDRLNFKFEYSTKLFRQDTIVNFIEGFKNVIELVSKDQDLRIVEIDLMSEEEREKMVLSIEEDINSVHTEYDI